MINKIIIGTAQFGLNYGISNKSGMIEYKDAKSILEYAKINNITALDTATSYGNCHKTLGKIGVREMEIYTKISRIPDNCKKIRSWIFNEFEKILNDLNTTAVKALYFHNSNQLLNANGDEIYQSVIELKKQKMLDQIGFSVYSPSELSKLFSRYQPDIVQLPYNILDKRFSDSGWLNTLTKNKIEIHARSIFLQGLLFFSSKKLPSKFLKYNSLWIEYENWLKKTNQSAYEGAMSFVFSDQRISRVVIGVESVQQLAELLKFKLSSFEVPEFKTKYDESLLNPSNWSRL